MKKFILVLLLIPSIFFISNSNASENKYDHKLTTIIVSYEKLSKSLSPFNEDVEGSANAQLPDLSDKNLVKQQDQLKSLQKQLQQINVSELSQAQQINHGVLTYKINNQIDNFTFKAHYMPLTAESGFHASISWINQKTAFENEQNYLDYLARMRALPDYFDQQVTWMKKGMKTGYTQPKVVLNGFEESIAAFIVSDATKSDYFKPFLTFPKHFSASMKAKLRAEAKIVIENYVIPSYQQYYDFFVNEYQKNARENIAATSLPNGKAFYLNRLQHFTTLPLSVDEVHNMGLAEVKRIKQEMLSIIDDLGFKGTFADFVNFLRTDEQFYAKTPEGLLKEAAFIAKKMDAQLPKLFKTLPRTPYGVMAVPESIAPKYTTGRYAGPTRDDQPGYYWVNTYRLDRRPLYVLEALTLHEAVPGHHLQGSIAKEMQDVPAFRNDTYISAFGEGWGLYSEYLGLEAGFYQNPYSNFGRLTYEMWRACRLVVDTGMHAKGWSRQKAMDYLANNTALSLHNVKTEIDRYISWPGQALSYKIGELTIKRLRTKAEEQLGKAFDLREFHDEILKNGSMPLSMLEKVIDDYIAQILKASI